MTQIGHGCLPHSGQVILQKVFESMSLCPVCLDLAGCRQITSMVRWASAFLGLLFLMECLQKKSQSINQTFLRFVGCLVAVLCSSPCSGSPSESPSRKLCEFMLEELKHSRLLESTPVWSAVHFHFGNHSCDCGRRSIGCHCPLHD